MNNKVHHQNNKDEDFDIQFENVQNQTNINLDNLRTCVCGASKQIAREKMNIKKIIAEMNTRKDHLIERERKLADREIQ